LGRKPQDKKGTQREERERKRRKVKGGERNEGKGGRRERGMFSYRHFFFPSPALVTKLKTAEAESLLIT